MIRGRLWLGSLVALSAASSASSVSANRPVIESIAPTAGPAGTVVDVVGRGLGGASRARVGDTVLELIEVMPSRARVRVPAGATTGIVSIETPNGTVTGPEFRVTAPLPTPVIESFEPKRGAPGTRVTLRGRNFSPRLSGNVVALGGHPVVINAATPSTLEVTVPELDAGGSFHVRVAQAGDARSAEVFEIAEGVVITALDPARGAPGAEIAVKGGGFSAEAKRNRVFLNNVPLEVVRASPTELVVRLPSRVATGPVLVDVLGHGQARSPEPFVPQWPPTVVGLVPREGPPGTLVTVRGTNFGDDPKAVQALMGEAVLVLKEVHRTRLVVEIPPGASSDHVSIRVHGVGPAWSPVVFRVLSLLAITDFAPKAGPAGTVVTLQGQGFDPSPQRNSVTVGGRAAEVLEATETRLELRVTAGGSGRIEVRLPVGDRAQTSEAFVVTAPPRVDSVLPREGTVGSELAIRGRGFGAIPALVRVTLGGHPLEVRSVRDDLVVARITSSAVSGKLQVHVRLQGAGELEDEVRVLGSLAVDGVDPSAASAGDIVTVRGSGFAPGALVEFGGVASVPQEIAPDRMRVVVPDGARSGILVVRLADGRNSAAPAPFSAALAR